MKRLLFSTVVFILLWDAVLRLTHIEPWILPTPSATFLSLWESRELILQHSFVTIAESFIGLTLAVIIGVLVATLTYWSPFIKRFLYPLLVVSQTIPFIALAPLLVVWFGFGILPKIIIVALVCFFPIAVNLINGFSQVDKYIIRNLRVIGASRGQIFRLGVFPSSIPFFFSGLRIAGTYALLTAVVAEWMGAANGLGILLVRASKSYLIDRVFATIIVISIISLLTVFIIDKIYKLATPWQV